MRQLSLSALILLFISGITTLTNAQNPFKVGIEMGTVIPLAEFKSINNTKFNAGMAEQGFCLTFDGDYYLHNRFAISGRMHFGISSIHKRESFDWMKSILGDYFVNDSLISSSGYWQWSALLVGAKYNYPIVINKLYVETGLFSGLNISPAPTQFLQIIDEANKRDIFSQNLSRTSYTIPLMTDLGFRLVINQNIQLKIKASYYQANTHHQHVSYYVNENSTTVSEEINNFQIEVPIKALNFSVGLIYSL
jgi:hypothetical protein